VEALKRFHGHLGPYLIIGYRMGLLARERLGEGKMSAIAYTGFKPPISCLIDGIQFSTACTLGKGNIQVKEGEKAKAAFKLGDKRIMLWLKDDLREKVDREMSKEKEVEHSLYYFSMQNEALFEVSDVLDVV
jgi:formylmethanofuran dehydrogenase subunit E